MRSLMDLLKENKEQAGSKLDQLIAKLCPDGVEYKRLGECTQKVLNKKWKSEKNSFQYIDLSSVDRTLHKITETINE